MFLYNIFINLTLRRIGVPNEKQKILNIMRSLERDYHAGKASTKKYRYYMAKYQDRLNYLDKNAATNRIRSMQGKPSPDIRRKRKKYDDAKNKRKKEENDLVQKYIIDPKKGDKDLQRNKKKSKDSGTFKLFVILILIIGFTAGISVGIFAMNFQDLSVVNSNALVEDTAFPDLTNITVEETKNTTQTTSTDTYTSSSDTVSSEDTYTSDNSYDQSYDNGYESSSTSQGEYGSSNGDSGNNNRRYVNN